MPAHPVDSRPDGDHARERGQSGSRPLGGERPAPLASLIRPTDAAIARGRRRLHAKAGGIVVLAVGSYCGLVFADVGLLVRIACAISLAVAVVAIGTGIMHDANHGAFCRSSRANRVVAHSADLIGASSWVWRFKHNTLHHANPNVVGVDNDIDQMPFARLAPQQPWHPWHRYQHLYIWGLYGFLAAKWFFISDVSALLRGGFGGNRFTRQPTTGDVAVAGLGKLVHLSWAIVVPLALHPWWGVLAFYVGCSWLVGYILAMVFQLAHCTDRVEFTSGPRPASGDAFELRQLRATADIRSRSRFVRWLMGGLDHQNEHHLAPRLPHTLYPELAASVQALCLERSIPYNVYPSLWSAIAAHGRWLQHLGRRPTPSSSSSASDRLPRAEAPVTRV